MDARSITRPYRGETLVVFVPGKHFENFFIIEEGTGDNLLPEDVQTGYVDYLNYDLYTMQIDVEDPDDPKTLLAPEDGGMVLLKTLVQDITVGDVVTAVLKEACPDATGAVLLPRRDVIISKTMYDKPLKGGSVTGNSVEIIGEQTVECNGRILEQYIYNIDGYTAKNGLPFVALKDNIIIL